MRRCAFAALVLLVPAGAHAQSAVTAAPLPRTRPAEPTGPDITAADLMSRLYVFAADSMRGRRTGEEGNVKGTSYIADQLRRMGVQPAGEDGGYFQTLPLETRTLDTTSTVVVGGESLPLGSGYLPLARRSFDAGGLEAVYGGMAGDSASALPADRAAGRLVVLAVPPNAGLRQMFRMLRGSIPTEGATAVAVAGLDRLPARFRGYFTRPQLFVDDRPEDTTPPPPVFLIDSSELAGIFGSPAEQLQIGAAGRSPVEIHLRYTVAPVAYPARNVVGMVLGSDPALRGEYVALGAHNDHLGVGRPVDHDSLRIFNEIVRPEGADDASDVASPAQQREVDSLLAAFREAHPGTDRMDSVYNGADDDGSGSVGELEIAQKIAAMRPAPKRSILFVWHVGEEEGLYGSRYFTDHPTVPRDSIVAQLNMDMIGRGSRGDETGRAKDGAPLHGDPRYLLIVGSRRLSTELGDLIERVNIQDRHDLLFDYSLDADGHPANIYCRSDHYSYARYGIPVAFFTTGLHEDYHQVTDEPEYIDYEHLARVARLVEDVAVHVANLDHRVSVDHEKPDPNGSCQQ